VGEEPEHLKEGPQEKKGVLGGGRSQNANGRYSVNFWYIRSESRGKMAESSWNGAAAERRNVRGGKDIHNTRKKSTGR